MTFLEETFAAPGAPPAHRLHRRAAMAVLEALLPEPSSDLKGNLQPGRSLQQAAGYAGRDRDFADLMSILDHELRMVTPVDAEGPCRPTAVSPARTARRDALPAHPRLPRAPAAPVADPQAARDPPGPRRALPRRAHCPLDQQARVQAASQPLGMARHPPAHPPRSSWTPPQRRMMRAHRSTT